MDSKMTPGPIALRDELGLWYLLTPQLLAGAKATAELAAELKREFDNDTSGYLFVNLTPSMERSQMIAESADAVKRPRPRFQAEGIKAAVEAPGQGLVGRRGRVS